jgi:Mce-associated membrane protein
MSSQSPRPGSRRRIAGERRPGRPPATSASPAPQPESETTGTQAPDTQAPDTRATKTRVRKPRPTRPAGSRPTEPGRAGRREAPAWRWIAVLGVVVVVLLAVTAYLGLVKWDIRDVREANRVDEASRTAPSVAERAAATILSYNYKSIAADQKAAERYMTPGFRKKYDRSMKLVAQQAPRLRAKVDAEVKASGVSNADADRADVLVYVDQSTVSTANGGEPQLALNRALFRMKKVDGTWLVDDIKSY